MICWLLDYHRNISAADGNIILAIWLLRDCRIENPAFKLRSLVLYLDLAQLGELNFFAQELDVSIRAACAIRPMPIMLALKPLKAHFRTSKKVLVRHIQILQGLLQGILVRLFQPCQFLL